MPRGRKSETNAVQIVTMRLDLDTATYYRRRANECGTTLSEFLRNMIVQGIVAESALDIEQRMRSMMDEMRSGSMSHEPARLPESVLLSIYTVEQLLTKIVEARNVQDLYEAQDKARARLKREAGAAHG